MIGSQELILIAIIALLLFGSSKLPELARSLGSSMKEFKKGQLEGLPEDKDKQMRQSEEEGKDAKIIKLAVELGIDVHNKTPDQLIEEINSRITGKQTKN